MLRFTGVSEHEPAPIQSRQAVTGSENSTGTETQSRELKWNIAQFWHTLSICNSLILTVAENLSSRDALGNFASLFHWFELLLIRPIEKDSLNS